MKQIKWIGLGLGLMVWLGLPRASKAHKSWGISLEATDGCCNVEPEFSQPPPSRPYYVKPYKPRQYRIRRRRYRRRYRRRSKAKLSLELGRTRLWVQPDSGQLSWELDLLHLGMETSNKRKLWSGSGLRMGHLEGTRWPLEFGKGDFWMNTRNWAEFDLTLGYNMWFVRTGWVSYREIKWGVPDATAQAMAKENGENKAVRNSLTGLGSNFLLPFITTGLVFGPVRLEAVAALHSWDFRSYRLHSSLVVSKWGLGFRFTGAYQEDGVRMRMDDEGDTDPNELAQALWTRRYWEVSMAATADLSTLFGWNKNRWVGPLQLTLGVRYRNMLENRLSDTKENTLFNENPGSQWAFFGGVQIAFGQGQHPGIY